MCFGNLKLIHLESWQNMDRATSDLLEAAFQERPDGEITIHWGEWLSYDYNFRDMWQQRYDGSRTGRDRNIRRVDGPSG